MTFVLQAIKTHVKMYCHKGDGNSGVNLFWSIDNSLEVINAIKSKRNMVSEINILIFRHSFVYIFTTAFSEKNFSDLLKKLLQEKKRLLL